MSKPIRIPLIILLAVLLVLIRAFENTLFYDPLLVFFKSDYKTLPLPEMNIFALQLGIAFRYLLNSILSLGIIGLVFQNREVLKVSGILYGLLFIVLIILFSFIVYTSEGTSCHFLLFYVRRFLIQPLFLLILLPAFYFQKYKSN